MQPEEEFSLVRPVLDRAEEYKQAVLKVVGLLSENKLSEAHINALVDALPIDAFDNDYDEKFNLREELNCQIQVVRGLRKEIFSKNGSLKEGHGVDDATRVLNASRDLLKLLQTQHEELVNYERIQAIETSFLDVIAEMPLAEQERYQASLASYLEVNSPG